MRPATIATGARCLRTPPAAASSSSYRLLSTAARAPRSSAAPSALAAPATAPSPLTFLRSSYLPQDVLFRTSAAYSRHFSAHSPLHQQAQKKKKQPVKEDDAAEAAAKQSASADQPEGEQAKENKAGEEESSEQKDGEEAKDDKKKKDKKDAPPPPPHGDKTPWQVFTETLQAEFQASKEWNESTKQLSGGIHDFTQNPKVQKAREITDAAQTKTAEALKATGRAVGHGAAWTWDTMPVKGVRAAARVTGSGLEYATRPVRQTKAFQAVKETIDDGSSSRYGGWVEKEERRRRRELRELNELQRTGGKPLEPMVEDPE
jgi:import inner membrane translocase subunit TIM44